MWWSVDAPLRQGFWEDLENGFGIGRGGAKDCWEEGEVGESCLSQPVVRKIPMDVGKPSFAACCAVYEALMKIRVEPMEHNNDNDQDGDEK